MRYRCGSSPAHDEVEEAGEELALGEVAGRTEQHDDVVVGHLVGARGRPSAHVAPVMETRRGRVAAADEHLSDEPRLEEAVPDDTGRRRQPRSERGGVVDVAVEVREHAAVGRRGGVAHRDRRQRRSVARSPKARSSRGTGAPRCGHELRGVDDHHELVGCGGHDLLAGLRAACALHQPAAGRDLVGAVDRHVERVEAVELLDAQPELAPGRERVRRRRDADDVEVPCGEGREQVLDGRAGAEPDAHAVVDERRGGLCGDSLLALEVHVTVGRRRRRARSSVPRTLGRRGSSGRQRAGRASATCFSAPATSQSSWSARASAG